MADVNVDKRVFNKEQFKIAVDTNFSEFFAPEKPITVERFFAYYDELFFDIPLKGTNSHIELRDRSGNFIGVDIFAEERADLLKQIADLEVQLADVEDVEPEHPIFKNGSFIAIRNENIWVGSLSYMDKGVARDISWENFEVIIMTQNPQINNPNDIKRDDHMTLLSAEIFGQIPKGPPFTNNDFSGKNIQETESEGSKLLKNAIRGASQALTQDRTRGRDGYPNDVAQDPRSLVDSPPLDKDGFDELIIPDKNPNR
jgi:hypothetical protein